MPALNHPVVELASVTDTGNPNRSSLRDLNARAVRLFDSILHKCTTKRWGRLDETMKAYHALVIDSYQIGGLDSAGPVQPVAPHLRGRGGRPSNHEKRKLLELLGKSFDFSCLCEEQLRELKAPVADERDWNSALSRVETICNGFHAFALRLAHSSVGKRKPLIQDEYDVQRYLYALLAVDFPDVRPEEYVPSHAGSCGRMDFLLMPHGIVIEAKMTRTNLRDKHIAEQLIIDLSKYKRHDDSKFLVCFVYDPDGRIRNRAQVAKDLESEGSKRLRVKVIIKPSA